jgi:hypothetical protein
MMLEILLNAELARRCLDWRDVELEFVAVSTDSTPKEESLRGEFAILARVIGYEVTKEAEAVVTVETGIVTLTIYPQDKRRIAWYSGDTPPFATSWEHTMPVLSTGKVQIKIAGTPSKCTVRAELLIVTKREGKPC